MVGLQVLTRALGEKGLKRVGRGMATVDRVTLCLCRDPSTFSKGLYRQAGPMRDPMMLHRSLFVSSTQLDPGFPPAEQLNYRRSVRSLKLPST